MVLSLAVPLKPSTMTEVLFEPSLRTCDIGMIRVTLNKVQYSSMASHYVFGDSGLMVRMTGYVYLFFGKLKLGIHGLLAPKEFLRLAKQPISSLYGTTP